MFTFDFELDDEELDHDQLLEVAEPALVAKPVAEAEIPQKQEAFSEISLSKLLDALPSLISYSPLVIPISSKAGAQSITLARRDLFDARFQLIAEGIEEPEAEEEDRHRALEFLDAPSDLVPGVYEGGLKTWECSLDLVDYMEDANFGDARGKRVLEIGCGTAVPTLYLLQKLFSASSTSENRETTDIHVQDYNASVLELVTLPNIILAWYMSPASTAYRATLPPPLSPDDEHPSADPSAPSNLPLPSALKTAFQASLSELNIHLRFFSGSWEGFDPSLTGGRYDIIVTSETIYRPDGLQPLIRLMRAASLADASLDELVQKQLSLGGEGRTENLEDNNNPYVCLVAAKVLYFGVGGGVGEFVRAAEGSLGKGKVETVWEKKDGVGRKVMRVKWGAT